MRISVNSRLKRLPQAGLHVHCLVVKDAMNSGLPLNSKDHLVLNCQSVWVSIVWAVLVTMSFYMYNLVELVSLPYSYFLRLDTSASLSSQEVIELFQGLQPTDVCTKPKELVPRTEEGKILALAANFKNQCERDRRAFNAHPIRFNLMCILMRIKWEHTLNYTVCQTWLCVCMCSCFYMIEVGYKPVRELFEHSFEGDCFPSTFSMYKHATDQ